MLLDGGRIVVAGGASGTGAADLVAFVREGGRVVSLDINVDADVPAAAAQGGRSLVPRA